MGRPPNPRRRKNGCASLLRRLSRIRPSNLHRQEPLPCAGCLSRQIGQSLSERCPTWPPAASKSVASMHDTGGRAECPWFLFEDIHCGCWSAWLSVKESHTPQNPATTKKQ